MGAIDALEIARTSIYLLLKTALPLLLTALVVGLLVALFQALTHIQEASLVFIPKILSVLIVLFLVLPIYGDAFLRFAHNIFDRIVQVGAHHT